MRPTSGLDYSPPAPSATSSTALVSDRKDHRTARDPRSCRWICPGSGHADPIVGPRHGRCFAFGAAKQRAANMRLVLGQGEVELESFLSCLTSNGLRDRSPIVATFED